MRVFEEIWTDESGLILSAEAVTLGTLGVVGAAVGLGAVARSANSELEEMAFALRSLDQSFTIPAMEAGGARTAGSSYVQMPVEEAHAELREQIDRDRKAVKQAEKEEAARLKKEDRKAESRKERKKEKRKRDRDQDDDDRNDD